MVDTVMGRVDDLLRRAFAGADLPTEGVRCVPAGKPEFGDFQCNAAMALGKAAKRNPRDLAQAVAAILAQEPDFASVEVAGPGFLNLRLADDFVTARAQAQAASPTLGIPQSDAAPVLLDFGGPNVAKPLHVGHLRSLVIGEALSRIFAAPGDRRHVGYPSRRLGLADGHAHRRRPPRPSRSRARHGRRHHRRRRDGAALSRGLGGLQGRSRAHGGGAGPDGGAAVGRCRSLCRLGGARAASLADQRRDIDRLGTRFDLFLGESDAQPTVDTLVPSLVGTRPRLRERWGAGHRRRRARGRQAPAAADPGEIRRRRHLWHDRYGDDRGPCRRPGDAAAASATSMWSTSASRCTSSRCSGRRAAAASRPASR